MKEVHKIGFMSLDILLFIPLLIRLIKLEQFKWRYLTEDEIRLAKSVFGNLIDYRVVKIMNQLYLPWQSHHVFMAPEGHLHIPDIHFKQNYAKENLHYQAIFIHEMTHILQYQNNINVLFWGACLQTVRFLSFGLYNPYTYKLSKEKRFVDYNIEQQGDIAKDIFLQKIPNIILCDQSHKNFH